MAKSPWFKLGVLFAVVVVIVAVIKLMGIDVTQFSPERIKDFVQSFGPWAPAVYILGYAQPIIPLPASVMTISAGLAFEPFLGACAALTGASLRAYFQFLIARFFGRSVAEKFLKGKAEALDQKIGENAFKTVLLIRLIPNLPFDVQNYGLGLSRAPFPTYALATTLGILPGSFAFVYLGYSLSEPKHLWKLGVAILVIVLMMVIQNKVKKVKQVEA